MEPGSFRVDDQAPKHLRVEMRVLHGAEPLSEGEVEELEADSKEVVDRYEAAELLEQCEYHPSFDAAAAFS